MNFINKTISKVDRWQRRHPVTAFPYAVIKKYGDDEAGYQAALLTYYAFLSLFPLLLVLTTLVSLFGGQNEDLRNAVIKILNDYFPTFGNQLSSRVQGINKSGAPLIIGILFTLYGARGVADAFRNGVNHIWQTPKSERPKFPGSVIKSFSIIFVGGLGFLLASVSSGFAAAAGRGFLFRSLSIAINIFILFWLFRFLINMSLPKRVPFRQTRSAAAVAAVGLVLLQLVGNIVLSRELKTLDAVYSYFAVALGLLFWLYLQAQLIYYSVEIASVRSLRLYPRGIQEDSPTAADKRALVRQNERDRQIPN